MIELSEDELCRLIKCCADARRVTITTTIDNYTTKVITKQDGKPDGIEWPDDQKHSEEETNEEISEMSPESACVIASQVGGPFQVEIQRAIYDTLREVLA